jgi:hypothetical protein
MRAKTATETKISKRPFAGFARKILAPHGVTSTQTPSFVLRA